ncbi:23S rRNA (guanosine(2251)-2'-O)-methyltransferase RlmB [Candidatus Pseudothioglobus sp. Uisw_016]|uniref:23S rRNA (guanosine(2251)-2'-O)-methyltransferase RlmB n=1 Tax=Candidatus Pseudothioglobus sp. Uisw_016 TaxID=3230995 RepID=UPI003A8ADEBF
MSKSIFIFGFHSIESLLNTNPESVLKVFIQTGRRDLRVNNLNKTLFDLKIPFSELDKSGLDRIARGEVHQGVISEVILPPLLTEDALLSSIENLKEKPLILILDSIQDSRNLGACLRSANAAGASHVIINKDGSAPINALVHKTSAGAINSLQIFHVTNLSRTIKSIQEKGIWVIGLDGGSSSKIYDVNLSDSIAIVMGTEGKGIRQLIKKTCDQLVSIPMSGNIESLNISVATGIALFESKRQRESS